MTSIDKEEIKALYSEQFQDWMVDVGLMKRKDKTQKNSTRVGGIAQLELKW